MQDTQTDATVLELASRMILKVAKLKLAESRRAAAAEEAALHLVPRVRSRTERWDTALYEDAEEYLNLR